MVKREYQKSTNAYIVELREQYIERCCGAESAVLSQYNVHEVDRSKMFQAVLFTIDKLQSFSSEKDRKEERTGREWKWGGPLFLSLS